MTNVTSSESMVIRAVDMLTLEYNVLQLKSLALLPFWCCTYISPNFH